MPMPDRAMRLSEEFRQRGHRAVDLDDPYVVGYADLRWAVDSFLGHGGSGPLLKGKRRTLVEIREKVRFIFTARNVSNVVRDAALAEAGYWSGVDRHARTS